MRRSGIAAAMGLLVVGAAVLPTVQAPSALAAQTGGGTTFRANVSSAGVQANWPSTRARISQNGLRVVYQTKANNLVAGDTNNVQDFYWTDLTDPYHPVTRRVSTTLSGGNPNGDAELAELSGDGRYVVFSSLANNMGIGGGASVYIRDMHEPDPAKAIKLVSNAATRPVVSDNARFISYNTLPVATSDIYVKDMNNGRTLRITTSGSDGNDAESFRPEISGDGNHIVFASDLNLLPNDTNLDRDTYVADISDWAGGGTTFTLKLVSVGLNGQAVGLSSSRPGINRDGSVVSFQSRSGNIVSGDTNGKMDAFVRDYRSNSNGVTYAVGYRSDGTIPTNAESSRPQLDDSGDIVTFVSTGGSIVNGDTNNREDAFIRNWKQERNTSQWSKSTYLLGIGPAGEPGLCPGIPNLDEGTKDISTRGYLSGDGKVVVFISGQCNLTPPTAFGGPDTNLMADVFVRTFRGVAPPPPPTNYQPLPAPARLLDTRPGGSTVDGQFAGIGARPAGSELQLTVGGRGGLAAAPGSVVLNVTVTGPSAGGYVTIYPCGQPTPNASNLNFVAGETVPNAAVSKVSNDGKVCLFTSATTHLIVDVGGAFPGVSSYAPLNAPARLLDTRIGGSTIDGQFAGGGTRPAGSVLNLTVRNRAGVPNGAQSVVLNVTVAGPSGSGYVTVYPCGQQTPNASNLNFVPFQIVPNAVMAKIGTGGAVCLFTSAATELLVDVGGYFPDVTLYSPLNAPARLLDTRPGGSTVDGQYAGVGPLAAGGTLALPVLGRGGVGVATGSVVLNVTVVGPIASGFVTVYPCGESLPNASNLNFVAGEVVPNAVVAKVGQAGAICLYSSVATHVLVDVAGTLP